MVEDEPPMLIVRGEPSVGVTPFKRSEPATPLWFVATLPVAFRFPSNQTVTFTPFGTTKPPEPLNDISPVTQISTSPPLAGAVSGKVMEDPEPSLGRVIL